MKRLQKIDVFSWKDVMHCRNELFGVAIIWIILFHIFSLVGLSREGVFCVFSVVLQHGNMGVDIFLFLSAIGLSRSIRQNDCSIFFKHRFQRVVLPYALIAIPFFIWLDLIKMKDGIGQLMLNISTLQFWLTGDHPTWYVAFIILVYLFFPLLYRWDNLSKHISTVLLIFLSISLEYVMQRTGFFLYYTSEKALSRVPVFLVGILAAPYVLSDIKIEKWQILFHALLGCWLFLLCSFCGPQIVLMRYLYCIISISIIICYAYLRRLFALEALWSFFAWLGGISLELYLAHVFLIRIIRVECLLSMLPALAWWFIIPAVSLLLALFLQWFTQQLLVVLNKKG